MSTKKHFLILVTMYSLSAVFLLFTDPTELPVPILVLPSMMAFITIFATILFILSLLRSDPGMVFRNKDYVNIFIVAMVPTLILLLRSLRQLTAKDIVFTIALAVIAYFYSSKLTAIKDK